jgi:hypothetical protein
MTNQPTEAVIAGSKAFALALLAPLTERVGTRPRIAADPSQVLKLTGGSGLVVVEFQGDRSLEAIRALLVQAAGLDVIAAVPDGHLGAEEALRALGVEPARWDGRPDGVLSVLSRRFPPGAAPAPGAPAAFAAAPPLAAPPAPAAPAPVAPAAAPVRAAASGVGALFDDLPLDEPQPDAFDVDVSDPLVPAPPAPSGPWPSSVPGAIEAADALGQGLQGVFAPPGTPLAVVAEVMAGMSRLERAVLLGEPQPVDTEPVRRAAVMRVRVAAALATAPQEGAEAIDPGAVSALLAEIDGLLSDVNALVAAAPAELQPSLEEVRNGLVKEAIDFSEAAHRAQPAGAPSVKAVDAQAAAIARKAAQTRVVSVASRAEQEVEKEQERRQRWMFAVLALSVLGAALYHGYDYWQRRQDVAEQRTSRAGVPADAVVAGAANAPAIVKTESGRAFSPEELKRIEGEEALRGNAVRAIAPGEVIIIPTQPGTAPPGPTPR